MESLADDSDEVADAEWSDEIARRLEGVRDGRVKTIPWDEARKLIRGNDASASLSSISDDSRTVVLYPSRGVRCSVRRLMFDIAALLCEPERQWSARPPANHEQLRALEQASPIELPSEYLELLRYCNGGEGPLALPPLYFALYEAELAVELNTSEDHRELYPAYFTFGTNGGMEAIAFDLHSGPPWPIVMYDPIAGEESAIEIAKDMASFVSAIGIDAEDESP